MTKTNKKMKTKNLIILIIFLLVIGISALGFFERNRIKLYAIGYSKDNISLILNNANKEGLNYVLNNKEFTNISEFIKNKDYSSNNLKRYLIYYQNNKEININNIIILTNGNADNYPYSDSLLAIVNNEEFDVKNISKYYEYLEKYSDASSDDIVYLINNGIIKEYTTNLVSIIKEKYYIENNLDRYIAYANKNTNKSSTDIVKNVNSNIDSSFYTNIKDTDTSKGFLLITNKFYKLSSNYVDNDLVWMGAYYTLWGDKQLNRTAFEAFKKLVADAEKEGLYLAANSAYRSYNTQASLYTSYVNRDGTAEADTYSARAGHSEHQTGLAIDVRAKYNTGVNFENTKEFTWMKNNCYKYGYILRYPYGKEYLTGYMYESWHYRYVGVEVATFIYENDLTFEEYYEYYVKES